MLGTALLADDAVTRTRTREELRDEGPETERPLIFTLAGIVRDVLLSRGEGRFAGALLEFERVLREMPEAQEVAEIEDRGQEHQAG
jgi:hypothetical protein